jgi:hypothetical protein
VIAVARERVLCVGGGVACDLVKRVAEVLVVVFGFIVVQGFEAFVVELVFLG